MTDSAAGARSQWHRRAAILFAVAMVVSALLLAGAGSASARAQDFDQNCTSAEIPPVIRPANPLRFGVTPLAAGNVGSSQSDPKPANRKKVREALGRLRPRSKQLVLRLNRMFWADGRKGIQRYAKIVDRYSRAGFDTELQVRYHPPEGQAGNMRAWKRYVRSAVRILGRRESVVALSITNEANFAVSPNTSDGSYEGVREAVVKGTTAADRELRRIGRRDIELGFSFAWRWLPASDREFWEEIGEMATPRFRRALDYVGLQIYPGLVFPPAPRPGISAGEEVIEALTLLRRCYMPKAGLGRGVDLWVSENGYATNLGRTEAAQRESLGSTLRQAHRYSGTLGVSDYRYFNLRDNDTTGSDYFDAVGILRDDYSRKPAFGVLRDAIRAFGEGRG